jgi:hypothetical protein
LIKSGLDCTEGLARDARAPRQLELSKPLRSPRIADTDAAICHNSCHPSRIMAQSGKAEESWRARSPVSTDPLAQCDFHLTPLGRDHAAKACVAIICLSFERYGEGPSAPRSG